MSPAAKSSITLKGSVAIVTEFLEFGINSILFQRGIYPNDHFTQVQKYGIPVMLTNNEEVKKFIRTILTQLQKFTLDKCVHRLVLVIVDVRTNETIEKWDFKIELTTNDDEVTNEKTDLNEIQKNIRDVIRQITASVSFLPFIDKLCCFDILLYTDKNTLLPSDQWSDGKPPIIAREEKVQLRSFSTGIHEIDTIVAYKKEAI